MSLITRGFQYLKQWVLSLLRYPVPCEYNRCHIPTSNEPGIGYLLFDRVEEGRKLSKTFFDGVGTRERTWNLFSSIAKIHLALYQKPFRRNGSLTIDDEGIISLSNRPLRYEVFELENEYIPCEMPRDKVYSTCDSYVRDILHMHDNRLRYQPNGASDLQDCISQMAALSTMRTISSDFFDQKLQSGPFVLTFTMNVGRLTVDDDWRITNINPEWVCSRPLEMQHPPSWITLQMVDQIDEEEYGVAHAAFTKIFEHEERKFMREVFPRNASEDPFYSNLMRSRLESKTLWYCLALGSPSGLHHIFYNRLRPMYPVPDKYAKGINAGFDNVATTFWSIDSWALTEAKVKDKEEYNKKLLKAFQDPF